MGVPPTEPSSFGFPKILPCENASPTIKANKGNPIPKINNQDLFLISCKSAILNVLRYNLRKYNFQLKTKNSVTFKTIFLS